MAEEQHIDRYVLGTLDGAAFKSPAKPAPAEPVEPTQLPPDEHALESPLTLPAPSAVNRASGASRRGSHRLSDVMLCEKKWFLRYQAKFIEVKDKKWRQAGTLIHQAIAWHYATKMSDPPLWFKEATLDEMLQQIGRGRPAEIRNAYACLEAYKAHWARMPGGDPWVPKYIEQEFEVRVGDLDPKGEDEVLRVAHAVDGKVVWEERRLNDEVVTCRPDLIVDVGNGRLYIVDHKTQRPQWGKKTLAKLKDDGEFRIHWQALFNLHVVRKYIPHLTGFIIQRINRDPPHDPDRHALHIPLRMYQEAPRIIRGLVKRELELGTKLALGGRAMPSPWNCMQRWGHCDYLEVCASDDVATAQDRLAHDFVQLPDEEDE